MTAIPTTEARLGSPAGTAGPAGPAVRYVRETALLVGPKPEEHPACAGAAQRRDDPARDLHLLVPVRVRVGDTYPGYAVPGLPPSRTDRPRARLRRHRRWRRHVDGLRERA